MYSAIQIANFIIKKHLGVKKCPIGPIQLQKMLYICYGWYWGLRQKKLFGDEIEAWKHGPVIPFVWYAFLNQGDKVDKIYDTEESDLDTETQLTVEGIYEPYIDMKPKWINEITSAPGTPWNYIYRIREGKKEMAPEDICRYFDGLFALREEREEERKSKSGRE